MHIQTDLDGNIKEVEILSYDIPEMKFKANRFYDIISVAFLASWRCYHSIIDATGHKVMIMEVW